MELKDYNLCSQEPATGFFFEPEKFSQHPRSLFLFPRSILILSSYALISHSIPSFQVLRPLMPVISAVLLMPAETLIGARSDSVGNDSPSLRETDTRHKPVSNKAPLVIPVHRRSCEVLKGEALSTDPRGVFSPRWGVRAPCVSLRDQLDLGFCASRPSLCGLPGAEFS